MKISNSNSRFFRAIFAVLMLANLMVAQQVVGLFPQTSFVSHVLAQSSPPPTAQCQNGISCPVPMQVLGEIGDSITQHSDINPGNSNYTTTYAYEVLGWIRWANWFGGQAFQLPPTLNFGVSGNTTSDVLARMDAIYAARLNIATLMIGTNDLTSGTITTAQTIANTKTIITNLTSRGTTVLWMPILPRATWGALTAANAFLAQQARSQINEAIRSWIKTQLRVFEVGGIQQVFARQDAFYGTATAGSTTSLTLPTTITGPAGSGTTNATDSYYKYWRICFTNTVSLGYCAPVTAYTGATRVLSFATLPNFTGSMTVTATANTVLRNDGGSWITDGYVNGASVTLSGFVNGGNNGSGSVLGVTASTLTVSRSLTTETASATIKITTPTSATVFLLDPYGAAKDGYTSDGLHPNATGAAAIAQVFAPYLATYFNAKTTQATNSVIFDPTTNVNGNLLLNPNLVGTSGQVSSPWTGTAPAAWRIDNGATYTSTGTKTVAQVARSDATGGVVQRITIASLTGGASQEKYFYRQRITPGPTTYQAGDVLVGSCLVQWSNVASINALSLQFAWTNDGIGTTYTAYDGRNNDVINSGLLDQLPSAIVPSGLVPLQFPPITVQDFTGASSPLGQFQIEINADAAAATPASITVDIAQCALRKQSYLLNRDLGGPANDNSPAFLAKVG